MISSFRHEQFAPAKEWLVTNCSGVSRTIATVLWALPPQTAFEESIRGLNLGFAFCSIAFTIVRTCTRMVLYVATVSQHKLAALPHHGLADGEGRAICQPVLIVGEVRPKVAGGSHEHRTKRCASMMKPRQLESLVANLIGTRS